MSNLFGQLQRQVSALQMAAPTSINTQLDNEILRNMPYVQQFISYQLIDLHNRPLSKRVSLCDTEFSSVLRRHPLEISIPCAFQSFTHIPQHISRTVKHNNTRVLPNLATTFGGIGSKKKVHVVFENIESFLLWLTSQACYRWPPVDGTRKEENMRRF